MLKLLDNTLSARFLLDKEKHIIAKKLTWEQIDDFLHVKWNTKTAVN